MRFEHILQIYWTKGFFFGGKLLYFQKNLVNLFSQLPGLKSHFTKIFFYKYELPLHHKRSPILFSDFSIIYNREVLKSLNIFFSQAHSVNNSLLELERLNIIRLYLARLYKGKCHAMGKPTRGQRTWSNAWTAYKGNKVLRNFIGFTKKFSEKTKDKKINYKLTSKKYLVSKKKKSRKIITKAKIWF